MLVCLLMTGVFGTAISNETKPSTDQHVYPKTGLE